MVSSHEKTGEGLGFRVRVSLPMKQLSRVWVQGLGCAACSAPGSASLRLVASLLCGVILLVPLLERYGVYRVNTARVIFSVILV